MTTLTKKRNPMAALRPLRPSPLFLLAVALVAGVSLPARAGQLIAHNTPSYVASAKNLGPEDPSKIIEVSIWLKPHDRAALDQTARDLYNRNSPNYRHWLKSSDIAARFAPTAAEAQTVQNFFESRNLKVVTVGPNNFYVRARGAVADVQTAFHVLLNDYQLRGETIRSNDRDPYIDGDAAVLVHSVAGLDAGHYTHPLIQRPTFKTKNGAENSDPSTPFFSSNCFNGTKTERFTTNGTFPKATFNGNNYFTNVLNPGCGYTPPEITAAYNVNGLFAEGYNGAGQTIVIVDWCGSLTIQNDANGFSYKFGLPQLNSSNFQIIQTPRLSTCAGPDPEINLDVEWAHAIAPGANIDLVVPPSSSYQDTDQAVFYAINYDLGNVVSGSYGAPESEVPPAILDTENLISEIGAISGISTNFATGDYGDFTILEIPPTVNAPASAPYATAIGGVSLALTSANGISWQAGWGTDETILDNFSFISDPPAPQGFSFGSGGGPSGFFPAPPYQSGLNSAWRQLPDVSWLADPFTGVVIYLSEPGQSASWYEYGGTSLATPMFSALWAIANQEAGAPLGQAAPYMYTMPAGTIYDIVPFGSSTNVTASIQESPTVTNTYTADQVMGGNPPATYYSGLWNYPFTQNFVLAVSFGTDCDTANGFDIVTQCDSPSALTTTPGWDNVTGVGTPNAQAFADHFRPAK